MSKSSNTILEFSVTLRKPCSFLENILSIYKEHLSGEKDADITLQLRGSNEFHIRFCKCSSIDVGFSIVSLTNDERKALAHNMILFNYALAHGATFSLYLTKPDDEFIGNAKVKRGQILNIQVFEPKDCTGLQLYNDMVELISLL